MRFACNSERRRPTVVHFVLQRRPTVVHFVLRRKFVVGLTSEMTESWKWFRSHFGWTESANPSAESCMKKMTEAGGGVNRNDRNRGIERGSAEWDAVASLNGYDVRLYEYAVELFRSGGVELAP